jgi:PAS domain-containing protein
MRLPARPIVRRRGGDRDAGLADLIPQLAWMADEKGWIYWYNRRWYEYTGTTLEQVQGWGWRKVHNPDHVDRVVDDVVDFTRDAYESGPHRPARRGASRATS